MAIGHGRKEDLKSQRSKKTLCLLLEEHWMAAGKCLSRSPQPREGLGADHGLRDPLLSVIVVQSLMLKL